jgi:hypothetical protein
MFARQENLTKKASALLSGNFNFFGKDFSCQSAFTATYFLFEVPPFAAVTCWWSFT